MEQLRFGDVQVDVVYKDIKNVHLGVHPPTGRVRISVPERMSLEAVRLFAIRKLGWIKTQQQKLQGQERETPREYLERESHFFWGRRYLLEIKEGPGKQQVTVGHRTLHLRMLPGSSTEHRANLLDDFYREALRSAAVPYVAKWEKRLGVRVERIFIRKMKTLWGSCNAERKTIRLNLDLAKKWPECLDYVVLHEICHFLVPDHGEKFVTLLDQNMPAWPEIRKQLNEAPLSHAEWKWRDPKMK